jgi:SulP family sulfate permease
MSKAIAARTGQKLDVNQQCLSEGAANLVGGFFQCFPGSGSLTRSAVNQQAGAVSQWSGVFAALAVAVTVLLLAPLASYIPRAALAGLLILAAYRMVDGAQLLFHIRATRFDAGVVIATALAAVLISIEFCIVIGVFLSFALYVPKAAQVRLTALVATPEGALREMQTADALDSRMLAFELDGELFFGAEAEVARHLASIAEQARGDVRIVVLVVRRGRNPDAVFLNLLGNLHKALTARGVVLLLAGVLPGLETGLAGTGLLEVFGRDRVFAVATPDGPCGAEALALARRLLDEEIPAPDAKRAEMPLPFNEYVYTI